MHFFSHDFFLDVGIVYNISGRRVGENSLLDLFRRHKVPSPGVKAALEDGFPFGQDITAVGTFETKGMPGAYVTRIGSTCKCLDLYL